VHAKSGDPRGEERREIAEVTMFVSPDLFASFGLPDRI
jgi:hypothetical protein